MQDKFKWWWVVGAVCIAGCQTRGPVHPLTSEIEPPPRLAEPPSSCRAAEAAFALGRHITAPLLEEMRLRTGARLGRTVTAGDLASADFDAMRLNVDIEPSGRIVAARCG